MPEATVLYSVAGVVIAGLVGFVGFALATWKEPWSRPRPLPGGDDTALPGVIPEASVVPPPSSIGGDPPPVAMPMEGTAPSVAPADPPKNDPR